MSDEIKCGSGKKGAKTKSGQFCNITVNPDVLKDYIEEYQGHRFVKLSLFIANEPDKYGKDVKITINTWKPGNKNNSAYETEHEQIVNDAAESDDSLPF